METTSTKFFFIGLFVIAKKKKKLNLSFRDWLDNV